MHQPRAAPGLCASARECTGCRRTRALRSLKHELGNLNFKLAETVTMPKNQNFSDRDVASVS